MSDREAEKRADARPSALTPRGRYLPWKRNLVKMKATITKRFDIIRILIQL